MMRTTILPLAVVLLALGCGGEETQQSEAEREAARLAARADSVAMAEAMYDPAVFDTITWQDENTMWERGGIVWSFSCQKCHGANGSGQGESAVQHGIEMPDLRAPDWEYAGDVAAIRHRIFVGHESEMPNWGLHGLSYRDVDAAARYIHDLLRGGQ